MVGDPALTKQRVSLQVASQLCLPTTLFQTKRNTSAASPIQGSTLISRSELDGQLGMMAKPDSAPPAKVYDIPTVSFRIITDDKSLVGPAGVHSVSSYLGGEIARWRANWTSRNKLARMAVRALRVAAEELS